tara:strand:+ start:345 stop:479 length:135 start_codon:yes stop_codon:yes gene_type:complete
MIQSDRDADKDAITFASFNLPANQISPTEQEITHNNETLFVIDH